MRNKRAKAEAAKLAAKKTQKWGKKKGKGAKKSTAAATAPAAAAKKVEPPKLDKQKSEMVKTDTDFGSTINSNVDLNLTMRPDQLEDGLEKEGAEEGEDAEKKEGEEGEEAQPNEEGTTEPKTDNADGDNSELKQMTETNRSAQPGEGALASIAEEQQDDEAPT